MNAGFPSPLNRSSYGMLILWGIASPLGPPGGICRICTTCFHGIWLSGWLFKGNILLLVCSIALHCFLLSCVIQFGLLSLFRVTLFFIQCLVLAFVFDSCVIFCIVICSLVVYYGKIRKVIYQPRKIGRHLNMICKIPVISSVTTKIINLEDPDNCTTCTKFPSKHCMTSNINTKLSKLALWWYR